MVAFLNWTSIFEWCVVRYGCKNGHQKDIMCFMEIGLCAQNMLNHSRLNNQHTCGGTYMTLLMATRIFTLRMNKIFIQALKIMRLKMAVTTMWNWQAFHTDRYAFYSTS